MDSISGDFKPVDIKSLDSEAVPVMGFWASSH